MKLEVSKIENSVLELKTSYANKLGESELFKKQFDQI